jgi:hypothetical protein
VASGSPAIERDLLCEELGEFVGEMDPQFAALGEMHAANCRAVDMNDGSDSQRWWQGCRERASEEVQNAACALALQLCKASARKMSPSNEGAEIPVACPVPTVPTVPTVQPQSIDALRAMECYLSSLSTDA